MCIGFFRHLFKREPVKPPTRPPKTWLERMQEKFPGFRFIQTSRGGLNMPKYQYCPQCHGGARREAKTVGGANYRCRKCGFPFFVRASRRAV